MFDYEKFIRLDKDNSYKYLYEAFSNLVFSIILKYTNNREDANDLSQEVWIKIFLNTNKFKDGNFKFWLVTLCHRVCIDNYRRIKIHKENYKTLNIDYFNFIDSLNFFENKYSSKNLLCSEILNSLNTLNETQQDLFLMKIKGLTYKEISVITKVNRFTIYDRHKSTIIEIIKQLEKKGIVKSKEIKRNINRHKTPNNLKLYVQV